MTAQYQCGLSSRDRRHGVLDTFQEESNDLDSQNSGTLHIIHISQGIRIDEEIGVECNHEREL